MIRIILAALAVAVSWAIPDDSWALVYSVALVLAARSPLRLVGELRPHARRVAFVCAVPVVLALIVVPLTDRPFQGQRIGLWLVSPLAQELLFLGFVFGLLVPRWPSNRTWRPTPALVVTAVLFSCWHLPNLRSLPVGYVVFQLAYTLVGMLWTGLTRQWTGSILYSTATHMAVNFIAWA